MTQNPDERDGVAATTSPTQTHESSGLTGTWMGPYRLLRMLGEGGMGQVWVAEQTAPVRRHVAVKVLKAGLDTGQVIARFEAERQALAVMDHPAIAKVFDAGSTGHGRPYFAMEYVRGESLITYCDRQRLGIRERLELFIQTCEGVQHAHQKGIIHRDLKPSNILVTVQDDRAVPKIIDFGIAKATTQSLIDRTLYTSFGGLLGTPEYMSPEQAELGGVDIDTRSDVYALGIVLYELLTGVLPFERQLFTSQSLDEIRRTIRETDPPRPSTRLTQSREVSSAAAASRGTDRSRLVGSLRGDLDWIVLRALEKDRTKRYQTANAIAQDLRRHLANEPVAAGPPRATYRMRKFARRHRVGVSVAALMLILIIAFSVVTVFQAARIARERDRANREAQTAEQVLQFLIGLFTVSDPSEARGNTMTAREVLDRGAATIESTLAQQPEAQARLQATVGKVYMNLGLYREAEELLRRSVNSYRAVAGDDAPETTDALSALADVRWYLGRTSDAESVYAELARRRERLLGAEHPDTLKTKFDLASAYFVQQRLPEAEVLTRATLESQRRVLGREHLDTLRSLSNLAVILHKQMRTEEALVLNEEALDIRRRVFGADHPDTLRSYHNTGNDYARLGRWRDAETQLEHAAAGRTRVLGENHPATIYSQVCLARVYRTQAKYVEAERLLRHILGILRVDDAPNTIVKSDVSEGMEWNLAEELTELYSAWGDVQKASLWRARVPLHRSK